MSENFPSPLNLCQDIFTLGMPSVSLGILSPVGQILLDGLDQFSHTAKAAGANGVFGQLRKESLHQVQPTAARGRKMQMKPGTALQPSLDLRMLMRAIVIHNQVKVEPGWSFPIDLLEKSQPFHMGVLGFGSRNDLALQIAQGRKQGDRSMPEVIVSLGANVTDSQRQARLTAFQCLALALFVAAEHQRLVRRMEVQPDHIPKLALKVGIRRHLEDPRQMRLQLILFPNLMHTVTRNPHRPGHTPHAPATSVRGRLGDAGDHLLDFRHRQPRLAPSPRFIVQPRQALQLKPMRPFGDAGQAHSQLAGDGLLFVTLGTKQDDARPQTLALGRGARANSALQYCLFLSREVNRRYRTWHNDATVARSHIYYNLFR